MGLTTPRRWVGNSHGVLREGEGGKGGGPPRVADGRNTGWVGKEDFTQLRILSSTSPGDDGLPSEAEIATCQSLLSTPPAISRSNDDDDA